MLKHKSSLIVLAFCIALWALVFLTGTIEKKNVNVVYSQSSNAELSGWAWSSNIGWISFKGTNPNYGVVMASNGDLSGYAWANPRDNAASPATNNIGWLSFNETTGCPGTNSCRAHIDPASGKLTGWARFLSADNNGWDGWVSLSCTNGADWCSHSDYGVMFINNKATENSYAWGSDVVGWIDFMPNSCPSSSSNCGVVIGGGSWYSIGDSYITIDKSSLSMTGTIPLTYSGSVGQVSLSIMTGNGSVAAPSGVTRTMNVSNCTPGGTTNCTYGVTIDRSVGVTTNPIPIAIVTGTNGPIHNGTIYLNVTDSSSVSATCAPYVTSNGIDYEVLKVAIGTPVKWKIKTINSRPQNSVPLWKDLSVPVSSQQWVSGETFTKSNYTIYGTKNMQMKLCTNSTCGNTSVDPITTANCNTVIASDQTIFVEQ